ncbi:MAG: NAD(+) synthase [Candidatus Niyogibacteria bacterium]|nr:MAG: NAD(+) synthase [Candidatus Niyogibacteria bacterium]
MDEMEKRKIKDFLAVENHGFLRVAVVIPRVYLANPSKNACGHFEELKKVYERGAAYAVCPELGITGYSCGDLFLSDALIRSSLAALKELIILTRDWKMMVTVGLPLTVDEMLFNAAVTFLRGKILAVTPKSYPPEYREFYELRHFAPAREARSKIISVLGQKVPFGSDILIKSAKRPDFVLHTEICEDIWVPVPPSSMAALAGATVLANLSASNITVGKSEYRESLVVGSSARNLAVQLYAAAGFGESTTDLGWDGDGYIAERGALLRKSGRFSGISTHIIADVDLDSLISDRMRQGSFRQNGFDNAREFRLVEFSDSMGNSENIDFEREIDPHPFVPGNPQKRDERCREIFNIQATSLMKRLEVLPPDRRKIVIGVSGGQDSTHALNIAIRAIDLSGLPRSNIIALTMPGFGTIDRTYRNACKMINAAGATFREIPIKELVALSFKSIGIEDAESFVSEVGSAVRDGRSDADTRRKKSTLENIQAWARKHILFSVSVKEGGFVLGTGDLSELFIGYCTMFGDHASHYGINAGVPKTLISYLLRWAADTIFAEESGFRESILDVLETPISPELLPPDKGKITQKTESIIGPYELHDFTGYYFVRFGFRPSKIARMALCAFGEKYSVGEIKKWLKVFFSSFFRNQFKRSCLPDGPKVGSIAISPRGDWRMPSDASAEPWLDDLDKVPDTISG